MTPLVVLTLGLGSVAHAAAAHAPPTETATAADATAPPAAPVVEHAFLSKTLENGLQVSILSDPDMPVVATQTWVQVGSAHEGPGEAGFAHLFEHLLFGDTTTHDGEDYARHHTMNGGWENAYTSFDNTVFVSTIQPAAHDAVLAFEADRLANLVLDQANLDNEKKIVTEELRLRTENDPASRLLGPVLRTLFGDHPYGRAPVGTREDIAGADLALVQKFYEGYYHPSNLHLVVVGPVPAEQTLARIEALFGDIDKERLEPRAVPPLASLETGARRVLKEDLPPIKVAALVYYGPRRSDPDYAAYRVMTEMLAGGELDRFEEELVTRQRKAIEAGTIATELAGGSILAFGSVSMPWRGRAKAFRLLHQTKDTLTAGDWRSADNLETVRRRLLKQELEQGYYASSMAEALGTAHAWEGDASLALEGSAADIDGVTLEQVDAAWRTYVLDVEPIEIFVKKGQPEARPTELPTAGGAW